MPDSSPSTDGDVIPPSESFERGAGRSMFAIMENVAKWLDLIRKVAISATVICVAVLIGIVIFREASDSGIEIDPVAIHLGQGTGEVTSDLATREVSRHFSFVQQAGAKEWANATAGLFSPLTVLNVRGGESISNNTIDLKQLGAPLNLRTSIREVFGAVGFSKPTIRASISIQKEGQYVAFVSVGGIESQPARCDGNLEQGLDKLFRCIAVNALAFVDPQLATWSVYGEEKRKCTTPMPLSTPGTSARIKEQQSIQHRRVACGFEQTQAIIAQSVRLGSAQRFAWTALVFGKIHLARAAALAMIDKRQEREEIDRAIDRFAEAVKLMPNSTGPLTVLVDAYVRKGISLHEATVLLPWTDDPTSPLQWHLRLAELSYGEAIQHLRRARLSAGAAHLAVIKRLEAALYYRQWMLSAQRRTKSSVLATAIGLPEDQELLQTAAALFADAVKERPDLVSDQFFFIEWGNVLRAMGRFDDAIDKYRHASVVGTADLAPHLNIVVAHLQRVQFGSTPADPNHVLSALSATSNYISWMSEGGPYPNLLRLIRRALDRTGFSEDVETFQACELSKPASDDGSPETARWASAADLKLCLGKVASQVEGRLMRR